MAIKTDQADNSEVNRLLHELLDEQTFRVDEISSLIDDLLDQLRHLEAELKAVRGAECGKKPAR